MTKSRDAQRLPLREYALQLSAKMAAIPKAQRRLWHKTDQAACLPVVVFVTSETYSAATWPARLRFFISLKTIESINA